MTNFCKKFDLLASEFSENWDIIFQPLNWFFINLQEYFTRNCVLDLIGILANSLEHFLILAHSKKIIKIDMKITSYKDCNQNEKLFFFLHFKFPDENFPTSQFLFKNDFTVWNKKNNNLYFPWLFHIIFFLLSTLSRWTYKHVAFMYHNISIFRDSWHHSIIWMLYDFIQIN